MRRNTLRELRNELRQRKSESDYTREPRARGIAAAGNAEWADLNKAELAACEQAKQHEFASYFALHFGQMPEGQAVQELRDQTGEGDRYRAGKWAFRLVEAIFAASIALSALNFGVLVSIAVGIALAHMTATATSAIIVGWVRQGAEQQPGKQLDRVRYGLLRLGPLWLVSCVCALTVLRSPEIVLGPLLFWISLVMIAILSPVCSGLCEAGCSDVLLFSRRISRELDAIKAPSGELELFYAENERTRSTATVNWAAKVTVTGLALMLGAGATARAANLPLPDDLPVRIYVDVSPSARSADAKQFLKSFAAKLPNYRGERGLAVSVFPFFEDAFMASPFIEIRISGNRPRDCPAPKGELAAISRAYADAQNRQCDQLRQQAHEQAVIGRSREAAKLSAAIDQLAGLKLSGRCSAVVAAIRRAAREEPRGVSLVVSDMDESCAPPQSLATFSPENATFLIPIGSRGHSVEASIDAVMNRFKRMMPWATVVEPYDLDVVLDAITRPDKSPPAGR